MRDRSTLGGSPLSNTVLCNLRVQSAVLFVSLSYSRAIWKGAVSGLTLLIDCSEDNDYEEPDGWSTPAAREDPNGPK